MIYRSAAFCFMLAAFSLAAVAAGGDEVAVYSNKDIEKYEYPSDSLPKADARKEKKGEAKRTWEQQDKEYWCKRATRYREKLEKAQEEAGRLEARLAELKDSASRELGRKRKTLAKDAEKTGKKLKTAQKQVRERQRDMDRLEEDAHSKGVPPGWLRCQLAW